MKMIITTGVAALLLGAAPAFAQDYGQDGQGAGPGYPSYNAGQGYQPGYPPDNDNQGYGPGYPAYDYGQGYAQSQQDYQQRLQRYRNDYSDY